MAEENTDLILLKTKIAPGERKKLNFSIAKLYTGTKVEIPIIIHSFDDEILVNRQTLMDDLFGE